MNIAQHACEEGHRVGWLEARILEIESNSKYRKYKESAHMACLTNLISQPTLDISPIWIPFIRNEVTNSQKRSVLCEILHGFSPKCSVFTPQMVLLVGTKWFTEFLI
jgi:hypothetical protein